VTEVPGQPDDCIGIAARSSGRAVIDGHAACCGILIASIKQPLVELCLCRALCCVSMQGCFVEVVKE